MGVSWELVLTEMAEFFLFYFFAFGNLHGKGLWCKKKWERGTKMEKSFEEGNIFSVATLLIRCI